MLAEMREELAGKETEIARLQQEKLELLRDARAAKDYRDELDCLQHKVPYARANTVPLGSC